jgi:hypothetical protein
MTSAVTDGIIKLYCGQEYDGAVVGKLWPYIAGSVPMPKDHAAAHAVFVGCPLGRLMVLIACRGRIPENVIQDLDGLCSTERHLTFMTCAVSAILTHMKSFQEFGLSPFKPGAGTTHLFGPSPVKLPPSRYQAIARAKTKTEFMEAIESVKENDEDDMFEGLGPSILFTDDGDADLLDAALKPESIVPRWRLFSSKDTSGRDLSKVFTSCPGVNLVQRLSAAKDSKMGNILQFVVAAGQELVFIDQGGFVRSGTVPDAPIVLPGADVKLCLQQYFSATGSAGDVPTVFDRIGRVLCRGPCSTFSAACTEWSEDPAVRWLSLGAGFIMARRPEGSNAWEALVLFVSPQVHHVQRAQKQKDETKDQPEAVVQFSLPGRPLFPGVLGVPGARNGTRLLSQTRPMFSSVRFQGSRIKILLYALPPFFNDGKHGKCPKRANHEPTKDTIVEQIVVETTGRAPTQVLSSTLGFHPLFPGSSHHDTGAFIVGDAEGNALAGFHVWIKPHTRDTCRTKVFYEQLGGSTELVPIELVDAPDLMPSSTSSEYRFEKKRSAKSKHSVAMAPPFPRISAAYDNTGMDLHQIVLGETETTVMRSRTEAYGGALHRTVTSEAVTSDSPAMEPYPGAVERLQDAVQRHKKSLVVETFVTTVPSTGASSFYVATSDVLILRYTYAIDRGPLVDAAVYDEAVPVPPVCAAEAGFEAAETTDAAMLIGPQTRDASYVPPTTPVRFGYYGTSVGHQPNMFSALRHLKTPATSFLLDPLYYQQLASGTTGKTRVIFTMPDSGHRVLLFAPVTEMVHLTKRGTPPAAKRMRTTPDDGLQWLADAASCATGPDVPVYPSASKTLFK